MSGVLEQPTVRALAQCWFGLRRLYYRTRYRRLEIGEGVVITGRLRLVGTTRLSLGPHSVVRQSVRIDGGGQVRIGAHTRLNGDCWIGASTAVTIGDWCLISDCLIFDDDFHNVAPVRRHLPPGLDVSAPIDIGHNVWIGTRAMVTKGVSIGDDSVIGAGAVVRKDVPPAAVAIGNPAMVVRTFDDHELPIRERAR